MTNNQGRATKGRPLSYTRDDLARAVAFAESGGQDATDPAVVRKVLVGKLGIPAGLNQQSLAAALQAYLAEREEEVLSQMIRVLPESVRDTIRAQASLVEKHLLGSAAKTYAAMRAEMDRELDEVRAERRQLATRCTQLEAEAAAGADKIAALETRARDLEAEQEGLRAGLVERDAELATLRARSSGQDDVVAVLRTLLSEHGPMPAEAP